MPATLTVRLYNTAGISAPELLAARRAAERLLDDAGMIAIFRQCGLPSSDTCSEPLKPSEVVVRLIDAPIASTALNPDAFGAAYVVRATNRGWLATVFADRIGQAADRVGLETGTLLGRVIAHEVGHLLLGADYHGQAGLMRAQWPDASLLRAGDQWRFTDVEATRMQRVIASLL